MADIINLRQVRKHRDRLVREEEAARNRAVHGRGKAAWRQQQDERERLARTLEGARREPD